MAILGPPSNFTASVSLCFWLTPYANLLSEILVRARDPRSIVEEALRKIPANYSPQSNMLTGFYRELAQKGRRYINISEAVIDIYKTPYNETAEHDRVQIYRGRRLLSQKQSEPDNPFCGIFFF